MNRPLTYIFESMKWETRNFIGVALSIKRHPLEFGKAIPKAALLCFISTGFVTIFKLLSKESINTVNRPPI